MSRLAVVLLLAAAWAPASPAQTKDGGQTIHLDTGDFRWQDIVVKQTPSEVECSYRVLEGGATVHIELLPINEFHAFSRGREHDTMALTPDGRTGEFRRIIDERGRYAVVVKNAPGARPVTLTLELRTNANPGADVARTISPRRRLTVILISFAFFFTTLIWSGRKLLRAIRL